MLDIPYLDKLGHFGMYAFFSAILLLDSCHWQTDGKFHYLILLIPLFFGALMEILQMTLTQRARQKKWISWQISGALQQEFCWLHIAKN